MNQTMTPMKARAEAVQRLLDQLESLVEGYRLPVDENNRRLSEDAECITGEVARSLAAARAAIAAVPVPR